MGTNIFAFIVVLGILVFFHELGHFLVARLFGVGVEKFSLGFGPRIFGKKVGITDYRVSAIPLGGYVKMVGEDPTSELDPDNIPISFTHKHVFKRILIVAAGPFSNFLLAALVFFGIFIISGTYILKPTVGKVETGAPAHQAGLQEGDFIEAIDGTEVTSWEDMAQIITESSGRTLTFSIIRAGERIHREITPISRMSKNIFGEDVGRYVIGIASAGDIENHDMGLLEAFTESIVQTYNISKLTILSVVKIIQGTISSKNLGGPIMIAELAGQQARQGAANLVFFIALLSVNLAIINFLPIPVLDGGHILFFLIEALIGKPVNTRMREIAQQAGIFILIMLMIFVFYNDITRIFFS
jgi:regulator of sigma E protease